MNVLHIKYAVEVAKTKSISKAAEVLYTAQPNLSRAIKELEDDLGITIFKRTSKGILVTTEGEEFLTYAKKVINQLEEIEDIYKNNKKKKQQFFASVPRASYISSAFSEFAKNLDGEYPADIYYKETSSMKTVNSIVKEDFNIGIIRYQTSFEKYYKSLFSDKKLNSETITEFNYVLLMNKDNPLAKKETVNLEDLSPYIEICHPDSAVPNLPALDVKKAELSEFVDKRIYVFERGSQFELLESMSNAFMWVSPVPESVQRKHNLIQIKCSNNTKTYKDVLIYRKGYSLTNLDNLFITNVINAKRKYL